MLLGIDVGTPPTGAAARRVLLKSVKRPNDSSDLAETILQCSMSCWTAVRRGPCAAW